MRKLITLAVFACLASIAWGQASVNESLETAFYWVDAVAGSDSNPGTQDAPFKTIGMGASVAEANNRLGIGSKVTINPGLYREAFSLTANYQDTTLPITFEAAVPGTVTISGADQYSGWVPFPGNPNIYTTVWPNQFGLCSADPGGGPFQQDIVLRREIVFVNGAPLTQVLSMNQMQQGSFYVDEKNAVIYIWPATGTSIGSADVEVGTRDALLAITNKSDVVVRGLTFQYSNACRTSAAVPVTMSDNVLLDNDGFFWNNAQGPAMIQATSSTVQDSVSNHNGIGGMADSTSKNELWTNNVTNYNNWRGAQGAYYLWSSSGFHPYATHGVTISGLTSAYNQTYGIHWDTDNRDITADNMVLSENLLAEGFVEKSEGPISITNSHMCGGNPTTGPAIIGFEMRNSEQISLSNSTVANDTPELEVIGTPGGYLVTDWETGQVYNLVTQNITLNNNILVGANAGQNTFYDANLNGTDWTSFLTTFSSDNNTWWNPQDSTSFVVPVPLNNTQLDLPAWQAVTLQDLHSSFAQPSGDYLSACTVTPEGPDFWYVTDWTKSLSPISAGGTTSFTTMAVPFGGFSGPINLTVDGVREIPGATSSWDTQTINTSGNATLTVNTSSTTPTGVYPITMVANNGAVTRTLTTSVLVNTVLAVAPSVANLGSIGVGSTTAAFPVTLANLGTSGVSISSITTSGDFTQTNTCGTQVGGTNKFNYQCSISVYFTPAKVGTRTGTLTITDADAGSPQKVTLVGIGIGVPITTLTPSSLTFPNTDVGYSSAAQTITVTNSGTGNLDITSISLAGVHPEAFQETNGCPTSLSPAGSCKITVTFIPTFSGTINATVSIVDSASTLAETVALTGVGVNPSVSLTPVSLAFGSQQVGTSSTAQKITLQNTGTGPLYLSGILLGGTNPQDYSESDNCPIGSGGLNPNASCLLTVTFTPTASGSRVATITVTDNAKNSPQTAYLNGNGTNFTVTLTPASMTFGNQVVGTQSTAKTATLTNKGTTTLNITTVGFSGTNGGDFLQTNACGKSVPPAGTCTISVTFAPTAVGARVATLQVYDNGYQSPQSVSITGTAVQPAVLLSPTSLSFSVQQINTSSKSQKLTVTNNGTGALTISAIAVGGTNQADFTQTNGCPISGLLGVGNSCYITVTFTPKAAGTRTASISISDNAPGGPHVVPVTGIGTAVTVSPSSLNFGVITVGRSGKAKTVTVTNLGSTSLTINGITLSGANASDFSQTNTCGSGLAGGATCTVTINFTPTAVGARAATLNVNDSDPGGPQTVSLTGTGI